jgi:hypothetical protein
MEEQVFAPLIKGERGDLTVCLAFEGQLEQ